MTTVGQAIKSKGHDIWSVSSDTSVLDALQLMLDKNIGAVLVMNGTEMAGIMSERDVARKMALQQKCSINESVSAIMTPNVVCVKVDQPIEECMAIMTARRVRHLPVCGGDSLVGMISIGDVVKTMIDDKEFVIEQLETYITGA